MRTVLAALAVFWAGSTLLLGCAIARDWWRHRGWERHMRGVDEVLVPAPRGID